MNEEQALKILVSKYFCDNEICEKCLLNRCPSDGDCDGIFETEVDEAVFVLYPKLSNK